MDRWSSRRGRRRPPAAFPDQTFSIVERTSFAVMERLARLPAPQVEEIELARPAVHILRGPRQVGKSTDLKLLAQRAQRGGLEPRQVVYLSLDLLEGQPPSALVDTVARALDLAGSRERPRLLLLDEVTSAVSWRTSVKALWDDGRIDEDVVICTGSSAAASRRDR